MLQEIKLDQTMKITLFLILFPLIIAAVLWVTLQPLFLFKWLTAKFVEDETIPVSRDDCFGDYREAISTIKPRWSATSPLWVDREECGLNETDHLTEYYPVIAFLRLCHLSGYEVEIRPMRREHDPLEEGEIVCRLNDEEWFKRSYEKEEEEEEEP